MSAARRASDFSSNLSCAYQTLTCVSAARPRLCATWCAQCERVRCRVCPRCEIAPPGRNESLSCPWTDASPTCSICDFHQENARQLFSTFLLISSLYTNFFRSQIILGSRNSTLLFHEGCPASTQRQRHSKRLASIKQKRAHNAG